MSHGRLEIRLRAARLRAGLSQGELAALAGVTRQAISAAEGGKAVPTTAMALRLARALGCRVEELFQLVDDLPRVEAELLDDGAGQPSAGPLRVQVAQVGERLLARSLAGPRGVALGLTRANGIIKAVRAGGPNEVQLFGDPDRLAGTLVAVGCDPAAALLADHLRERHPGFELAWQGGGSTAALDALARGEAHLAGSHLFDPTSGEYNRPQVRARFGDRAVLVTFAVWEAGLIVAAGNPHGLREAGDLARPGVRLVNREAGTGARALLDRELGRIGLAPAGLPGYAATVGSHLAVAEAIAAGLADVGIGVRAAAQALGLSFLPLAEERYDLVIPRDFLELPPVQAMIETLHSPLFRLEVEALGGYDVTRMGTTLTAA